MKQRYLRLIITPLMLFLATWSFSQLIVNDTVCVNLGEQINYNVTSNDSPKINNEKVNFKGDFPCFRLLEDGRLLLIDPNDENCCGEHRLFYEYTNFPNFGVGQIDVTVKCNPKPDCAIVDLDLIEINDSGPKPIIYACEGSIATYFTQDAPGNTYTWTVTGGTPQPPTNTNILDVLWTNVGSQTLTLTIQNGSAISTETYCIEVLEGPIADFMPLTSCTCLNSPITFINNSIGASSYLWDFGDGNFSNAFQPTHTYGSPGVYDVTLHVTKNNFDPKGNPLCCCTDSTTMQVEIDPRPGPNIFWVSTLCPGDSTKYWTDAVGCSYTWLVEDADGMTVPYTTLPGNDTICVNWGDGPHGVVTLQVTGCPMYCDKPVSALIPIISTISDILGDTVVCENSINTYDLPKWPTVTYDWTVTGGNIISGQGMHTVDIQWGPAGPGSIHVDYCSDFLGGLPGHEDEQCCGTADLDVLIKPEYFLIPPLSSTVCVGDTSDFSTSAPGVGFMWEVDPTATIIGQGTHEVSIIWPIVGVYQVLVYPTGINPFCNDTLYYTMNVIDIAMPDSITGEIYVCPGATEIYYGHSTVTNASYNWEITGGTPATYTGDYVEVVWDAVGPYRVCASLFMLSDPGCESDTICLDVFPKTIDEPLSISGPDGCVNSVKTYTVAPPQTYDVQYDWMIMPPEIGSIITDYDAPTIDVQWNNVVGTATLVAKVSLCGVTLTETILIDVHANPEPIITQIGNLCPGVPAILDAGTYSGYLWSTGDVTQQITITSAGVYTVTVEDANLCTSIASYEAFNVEGPEANITSPDGHRICIGSGNTITMHTVTNPDYEFAWTCNGNPVTGIPIDQAFITHVNTGTPSTTVYRVLVTDTSTGCTKLSDPFYVYEETCEPGGCDAEPYSLNVSNSNLSPFCNEVEFVVTSTNATVTGWDFDDPFGNGYTGTILNPIHSYQEAGYYVAEVSALVPNVDPGLPDCRVFANTSVCVPLGAFFEYTIDCNEVTFTDMSTYLTGHNIVNWDWDFGDTNSSSLEDPVHTYTTSGLIPVTLTVTDVTGCQATYSENIFIYGDPNPTVNASPTVVCVEDAVSFSTSGTGALISYNWDFGDGSGNGGATPSHSYLTAGTYTVAVTVTDVNGCEGVGSTMITVHPLPVADTIVYLPDLTVCDGQTVTLISPIGSSYLWSNGAISQSIAVSVSGTFSVVVTDANGCSFETEEVDVTILPPLDATISGNTVICESGCVTLSAPSGFGYTYLWSTGETTQSISVCSALTVDVTITNPFGCSATSPPVSVTVEPLPVVGIAVLGDLCAGSPNILTANPLDPNLDYHWSTGDLGPTITVFLAGVYTLYGTDPNTGCTSSASVTVNPIPDLCIVPAGCYETCDPDTICGPPDMVSYQWNLDGLPIPGEVNQCLIVTASGTYTLTALNSFGCPNTSEPLVLEVIPCCDDEDTNVTAAQFPPATDCCYTLSYENAFSDIQALVVHTDDADINLTGINPALQLFSSLPQQFTLVGAGSTLIPMGTLNGFADICLDNVTSSPVLILVDWIDRDNEVFCQDSLWLECEVEPDCIYLLQDSIYCKNDQVVYDMTICNSSSNTFNVGFIDIQVFAPVGVVLTPPNIDLSGSPLAPGACIDVQILLSGSNIANQTLCYKLIAHEFNPLKDPTTVCCSSEDMYYVDIPGCTMCDQVYVENIEPVMNGDSCCYAITVNNYFAPNAFTGIGLCVLTPGSTMSLDVPLGGIWTPDFISPTQAVLTHFPGPYMPEGSLLLPDLCISSNQYHVTEIEVKWMKGDQILCRDTIALECDGDCGHLDDVSIVCDGQGGWIIEGYITNTSDVTMETAYVSFNDPGLNIYNTSIALGGLAPGNTFGPFTLYVGPPASSGDVLDVTFTLHAIDHNDTHVDCCSFDVLFELPPCVGEPDCACGEDFKYQVSLGAGVLSVSPDYVAQIVPKGNFGECDRIIWDWFHSQTSNMTTGNEVVTHQFPGPGEWEFCMTVTRTQADGKQCKETFCGTLSIPEQRSPSVRLYPNPASNHLSLDMALANDQPVQLEIRNMNGQWIQSDQIEDEEVEGKRIDISLLKSGLYLMYIRQGDHSWMQKFIVIK